jgi:hypothetical protein
MAALANPGYSFYVAVTPSDTANVYIPPGRTRAVFDALYIGGSGDVVIVGENNVATTFVGAIAGTILPIAGKRVNSGSTSATDIVALFAV